MSFKPRMRSRVKSVLPLSESRSLLLDRMAIDYWHVEIGQGAAGRYMSPDPRFVIFLKGGSISLGHVGSRETAACSVCFVPAHLPLVGVLGTPRCLEHIDIHIEAKHLREAVGQSVDLDVPLFLPDSADLRQIAMMLTDECQQPRRQSGFSEALAVAAIHEVFAIDSQRRQAEAAPKSLSRAMHFAADNLDQALTVDLLASVAGLSRIRLTRLFVEHTGLTPWRWVMRARLERARALLAEGESIGAVAHAAGFSDQAHFSRCFRVATGLSPARWTREVDAPSGTATLPER
ncbi:MAG: AraC family transcriptional regulator [Pseudomonadota bacterium]